MSMEKTRALLETMTEFQLSAFKMRVAAIAFADPAEGEEPDEDSEYYDPTTQTYLDVLDLADIELKKRMLVKEVG